MELTNSHRQALLDKLSVTERDLELKESVTNSFRSKGNQDMAEYSQIDEYLLTEKVRLIKEALVNNKIDW